MEELDPRFKPEAVLAEMTKRLPEHIAYVKKLLNSRYVFIIKNEVSSIGFKTILKNNANRKIIYHSRPFTDLELE
ncbi:MAG: hypothetical protein AAB510_01610 [Patescibacteria group bacterium]